MGLLAMPLQPSFFEPFDRTWREVSGTMNDHLAGLPSPPEKVWLRALVDGVEYKRNDWLATPGLAGYFDACSRLRARPLRLMVATYLHISYDLPRVLADNWPHSPNPPPEARTEYIYFDLAPIFPDVLKRIVGKPGVTGVYSVILNLVSRNGVRIAIHWLMHLREAAWRHGRTLATQTPHDRIDTEQRMLRAMTAALNDVSDYRPWSAYLLSPPNLTPAQPTAVVIAAFTNEQLWLGLTALVATIFALIGIALVRRDANQLADFIDEFGRRLDWYMSLAVYEPSRFETALGDASGSVRT